MNNSLRIALWNANGLLQHKRELEIFLASQKIDIILISETHFTDKTVFKINNFVTYMTLHPEGKGHGGTAILINKSLPHYECPQYQTNSIQATNIKIESVPFTLTLSAVYCPPRFTIQPAEYKNFFQTLGPIFIAGGDWNAKHTFWGSRLITTKGRNLFSATNSGRFRYLSTGEPTYWPTDSNRRPDLLDFFIAHGVSDSYITVESSQELSSDHSPVILTTSTKIISKPKMPTLITSKTDWESFKHFIENKIDLKRKLKTPEDIDETVNFLTKLIQEAACSATPEKQNNKQNKTNIPLEIRNLLQEKRRARNRWHHTRNRQDKTQLNKLTRKLQKLLRQKSNESFENFLLNLSTQDDSLWKATKNIKKPQQIIPPLKKQNGSWARSNEEKASIFAEHLKTIFEPFPPSQSADLNEQKEIEDFLSIPCQLSLPIKYITPADVKYAIRGLKMNKAPGFDLITGQILKELPSKGIMLITHIFNAMLRLTYWPITWKYAEIVMIQKPNKPVDIPTSYRPISLLPSLSKIFEKLLLNRLFNDPSAENIIPDHQFGFRSFHSTVQQVHRVVNVIASTLEEKSHCSAVFLDITSAFDKVWHIGLLHKIKLLLPQQFYLLLKSYLEHRYFRVKFNGVFSDYVKANAGVPQGSVLGPYLYLLYTYNMPISDSTIIATYADDTAILSKHNDPIKASDNLQNHLDLLEKWLQTWRIKVNENKSVHVTFTTKPTTCPPVRLNDKIIPERDKVRYLGLHLDRKLTWKHHILTKRTQLQIKYKKMYWLLGRKSKLSIQNKILLYKMVLKPVWTYGIELWGCAKPSNLNIIQRFQSKSLRNILDAPFYVSNLTIHEDLKIPFVKEEILNRSKKYRERLTNHSNQLISTLQNPISESRRLKRTYPIDLFSEI